MSSSNRPEYKEQLGHRLPALVEVMRRLLAPDGCPWDQEQSLESLIPFLVEEAYEVIEAIETGTPTEHCDELGDLLLQVVFQAALRQNEEAFDIDDVIESITAKLIRRHPHVFADADAKTSAEVHNQWEAIKAQERRTKVPAEAGSVPQRLLDGVPVALPALARAQKLTARAARVGFDWENATGCADKIREELDEIAEAVASGEQEAVAAEIGDLLLAAVSLARKLDCDAETSLRAANRRFAARFGYIEDRLRERGLSAEEVPAAEMETLWHEAKTQGL